MQRSDRSETALREKAQVHTRVAYTAALLTHMNTQTPAHVHTHTHTWIFTNAHAIRGAYTHTHTFRAVYELCTSIPAAVQPICEKVN